MLDKQFRVWGGLFKSRFALDDEPEEAREARYRPSPPRPPLIRSPPPFRYENQEGKSEGLKRIFDSATVNSRSWCLMECGHMILDELTWAEAADALENNPDAVMRFNSNSGLFRRPRKPKSGTPCL